MDEKVVEYQISVTDASPEYIEYYPVAEEASDVDNQNLTDVEEFTSLEGEEEVGEEQIDGSSQQKSHLSMQALCALWFKSKVGVQTERNRDFREFELKYTSFVEGICPVFRSCCGVTNIGEDLPKLIEEMTKLGLDNFWPFENAGFQTNVQEMRELFGKILEIVKTCFMFACCERGYVISHADKRFKFSNRWKEEINSRDELVTFQVITNKLIELCESKNWTNGDMSFSNGLKRYFDVLIPALDNFNSEVLAENGISDRMNQIHSRKEIGFAISVEEVDEMLAVSLTMRGFGNFTACAMQCVDIFSTADQLEKILEKSGEMLKTIDIRTGIGALKAVTRIFSVISADESANIFEKCLDNSNNKPEISRILGYPPSEILKRSKNEKAELLKLFYVAHSVDLKERYDFDVPKCLAAIKAFYALFDVADVNQMILQILCNSDFYKSGRNLILAVNELPDLLKKQLEIGKLEVEDIPNDNKNSIYVQIKSLLKSDDSYIIFSRLIDVLPAKDIISTERILKMCVDSVKSEKAKNPRKVLMILKKEEVIKKLNISRDFTQKLVLCALESYKYLAVEKNRYDFIGSLLEIGGNICEKKNIRLDENYMVEKWKELKHPWFVEAYLKTRFKVLNFESMRIEYPWLSLLEWDASTVNISTYSEVVMVLTAWIRCDENVGCILDCVEKILPKDIDRQELLDKMVSKIDGLEISDGRKDEIREECDAAIHKIKSEAAISILELTMDKIQISNSKQEEVTPIEPASEDDKENEIVELPENKDDCLLHLDKEYWEKLTINQQLFIKNYREEVHRMDN